MLYVQFNLMLALYPKHIEGSHVEKRKTVMQKSVSPLRPICKTLTIIKT